MSALPRKQNFQSELMCSNRVKALSVYLKNEQLIPYERQSELLRDLFGHTPSLATLIEAEQHQNLEGLATKNAVAPVVCFDESGLRIEGSGHWIHSTSDLTVYFVHKGREAIKTGGILQHYKGIAVHDTSYPTFEECNHALHTIYASLLLCLNTTDKNGR